MVQKKAGGNNQHELKEVNVYNVHIDQNRPAGNTKQAGLSRQNHTEKMLQKVK